MLLSPLHQRARSGERLLLEALLADGAPVDPRSPCGWTPLLDAAWACHAGCVDALLEAGADRAALSVDGLGAMSLAAGRGHTRVVQLLLAAGADPDASSHAGRTPLEGALQRGHLDGALQLARAGAAVTDAMATLWLRALAQQQGRRCLLRDEQAGYQGSWVWLLDGPLRLPDPVREQLGDHLYAPPSNGLLDATLQLTTPVAFRVEPSAFPEGQPSDRLPSHRWRYRKGWTEHCQAIFQGEVAAYSADEDGLIASQEALGADAGPALAALLQAGADPNLLPPQACMRGATLLINAAHMGATACVSALLDGGADRDARSASGWTAMMVAAAQGQVPILHQLLRAGAELDRRNAQGQTALSIAQSRSQAEAARSLLVSHNRHHLQRQGASQGR